ncbi:hypothetical protein HG536_0C02410 [Torulaspora globosa]|uniref:LYC1 C-terminal domain-containing protein n=1 Tax=Torulaspora globosa TaxID=48254 RepID=A0A7G3ZEY6_9SACH|nr:uncharacterized protein HG536_0C02410 [Torulaspora globosa]QLL32072.1 hypothetical protein HG536_0C02410 [Torulaspora globosa]
MTVSSNDKLSFEEVSDPEIIRYTHSKNAATWRGLQTVDQYCERERLLGSSDIAKKGESAEMRKKFPGHELLGLKYFVLKNTELEATSATSQIVASCEALCRLGYAIHPGSRGKVVPILTACIGGVFTSPEHRGNGYAREMIHSLNRHFDRLSEAPDAPDFVKNTVITLYSEVGEYYAENGYQSLHVPVHVITETDVLLDRYCDTLPKEKGRFLRFDDYPDLVDLQKKQFESRLLKLHEESPEKFIFTVAADIDIYKWFQVRDLFLMDMTKRHQDDLKFGVALEDNSHIIWHHNWNDNSLVIVKIFMDDHQSSTHCEHTLRRLISHAINEIKTCGLQSLVFWDEEIPIKNFPNLYAVLSEMEQACKLYVENGSLSAVRPPKGFTMEKITWDNNTKFCWF